MDHTGGKAGSHGTEDPRPLVGLPSDVMAQVVDHLTPYLKPGTPQLGPHATQLKQSEDSATELCSLRATCKGLRDTIDGFNTRLGIGAKAQLGPKVSWLFWL